MCALLARYACKRARFQNTMTCEYGVYLNEMQIARNWHSNGQLSVIAIAFPTEGDSVSCPAIRNAQACLHGRDHSLSKTIQLAARFRRKVCWLTGSKLLLSWKKM